MATDKKLGPSDFQAEVERLQAAGKLPELHEVLGAVSSARQKFSGKVLKARAQGEDNEAGLSTLKQ